HRARDRRNACDARTDQLDWSKDPDGLPDLSDAHEVKPARTRGRRGARAWPTRVTPTTRNVRQRLSAALREKALLDELAKTDVPKGVVDAPYIAASAVAGDRWMSKRARRRFRFAHSALGAPRASNASVSR